MQWGHGVYHLVLSSEHDDSRTSPYNHNFFIPNIYNILKLLDVSSILINLPVPAPYTHYSKKHQKSEYCWIKAVLCCSTFRNHLPNFGHDKCNTYIPQIAAIPVWAKQSLNIIQIHKFLHFQGEQKHQEPRKKKQNNSCNSSPEGYFSVFRIGATKGWRHWWRC